MLFDALWVGGEFAPRAFTHEHRALHRPARHARHRVHADRGCVVAVTNSLALYVGCALGVTPCSHNPARMTAGSVRQGGNLMRVPSSPRLNPPFDGGRTGRSLLSFPKIPSERIRAMRENQSIIRRDACHPLSAWDVCRQPVHVAASA